MPYLLDVSSETAAWCLLAHGCLQMSKLQQQQQQQSQQQESQRMQDDT
jgi:hypothetical protein